MSRKYFSLFNSSYDYTESQKCNSCSKFLSNRRHKVSYCIKCKKICHDKCIERSFCKACLNISYVSPVLQNFPIHFDPFNIEDDNEHDFYFNDDVDYTNYTTEIAKDILKNCNYHKSDSLPLPKLNSATLYFNNIDGFKTNFNEFLSNRILHNHNFHFYCFNETNIHENCTENFEIEGYTSEFLHAIEGKSKGSGLAIYCHQNVKFQHLAYLTGRNKYFESLGGKFECDIGEVHLVLAYRYNQICKDEFHKKFFNKLLKTIVDKPCIILGDFNSDTLKYYDLHQTETFVDNFITYGFTPLISKTTNFFRSASTSIDHIWCNTICKNTYTGILNESTSSHKPIFANIATKINEISTDSESVTSYFTQNISARNIEKFESEIHKVSDACKEFYSNPNISSKEAQRQFSSFYTKLNDIYDNCYVEEVDNSKKRNFINKPWIALAVAKSCKTKNKLHNKWINARGRPNETQAKREFKSYRAKLRDIIRTQKSLYFEKRFNNCRDDIKKCWKVLNEIRNKRKKLIFSKYINFNGNLITQRRTIIEKFNSYFVNIANNLNKNKNDDEFKTFKNSSKIGMRDLPSPTKLKLLKYRKLYK